MQPTAMRGEDDSLNFQSVKYSSFPLDEITPVSAF